ncbi:MAG: MBOAT family O-acyltransferase [Bacillota bacterium]|nr:MBOAT family O-acyltransferase [Bacillota bacterium]
MVFSSLLFLGIFLPAVLLVYNLNKNITYKNIVLVVFSLFFYAWGEPKFVLLLIFTSFVGYLSGLITERYKGGWKAKASLITALVICLGSLGLFKYAGFFVSNVNMLFNMDFLFKGFALPLGISFYTFQILTYIIDRYRGEVPVQTSFLKFLTYSSMFPQLVSGPIIRYANIWEQIDNRTVTAEGFQNGIMRFCEGLLKKLILANGAGKIADSLLGGNLSKSSVAAAWLGIIMYTFQIYFDFSGYSDLAIGMGKFFGFTFTENFNYPYIARSITDFWRRWHISLSTFFRDYVYIPLGGNRKHQIFNILVVWMLTGFWHGASWNFILWGLFYGIMLIIEKKAFNGVMLKLPAWIGRIYTMIAVVIGWALFYFTDFGALKSFFKCAFGIYGTSFIDYTVKSAFLSNIWLIIILAVASTPLINMVYGKLCAKSKIASAVLPAFIVVITMLISYMLLVGQSSNTFLYFKF